MLAVKIRSKSFQKVISKLRILQYTEKIGNWRGFEFFQLLKIV